MSSCCPNPQPGGPILCHCGALLRDVVLANRWQIERAFPETGQARTYWASDGNVSGQRALVKELRKCSDNTEAEARFNREMDALRKCAHLGIPRVLDRFPDRDLSRHYLVMEFIDGENLATILKRERERNNRLPDATVVQWSLDILEVLQYIHTVIKIGHRDLKPSNMMRRADNGRIVVVDFGIARGFTANKYDTDPVCTPAYAAPEVRRGMLEPRSDLYSLGVMMHQFLTGLDPRDHASDASSGFPPRVLFPPISSYRPEIRAEVSTVIERALEYEADKRYPTAQAMAQALREATGLDIPPEPHRPGVMETPPPVAPWRHPYEGSLMVYVPPSPFYFGATEADVQAWIAQGLSGSQMEDLLAEVPLRLHQLEYGYWISQFPVTNAQYAQFLAANPQFPVPHNPERDQLPPPGALATYPFRRGDYDWNEQLRQPPRGREHHPVVNVTWHEACAYAHWAGLQLPSELEWERAARGTDGRTFPWGEEMTSAPAHCAANGATGTAPVDQYPAGVSPAGCWDMVGNVREWTRNYYAPYDGSPHLLSAYGAGYVATRGTSWQETLLCRLRCASRGYSPAGVRNSVIGFRCVRKA